MQINPELIQRFFENTCDPEEREAVLQYLQEHPDAMEKIFPWKDWEHANNSLLPSPVSEAMLQGIIKELFPSKKTSRRVWLPAISKVVAAAAILILITGTAALFILNKAPKDATVKKVAVVNRPVFQVDTFWVKKENKTSRPLAIVLPDGSTVRLQSKSVLKYQSVYGVKKRDVWLEGQAFFQVAKQKDKPFTVCTRSLNTTALGTSFTVQVAGMNAAVKLHTGKVVVKPVDDLPGFKKEIYLSPGEKISYNFMQSMVTVERNADKRINKTQAPDKEEQDIEFNNEPLTNVLSTLSTRYHQTINFNADDFTSMNFTGTIARTDSLGVILRLISNMNNLVVEETGNTFNISKSRQ